MTFVITGGCCNDASCVSVCPVQCIRPRPGDPDFTTAEQLYIDPATCIDCGACVQTCPVSAITADWELPEHLDAYLDINAAYFVNSPIEESEPPDPVRRRLPEERPQLSVAIVGSGPAGCYAASELSAIKGVTVSLFDRLPTPFGLVRAGVAPDHPNTKLIAKRFTPALARPNVHCFFNVEVGRDVSVAELLEHHHAVIWAGGASDDRRLGVTGENLAGSVSAREFVFWYNGHPDFADREFDLSGKTAVIIGNGNVALDVARILARSDTTLATSDMADHAIEALAGSGVTEIVVTGRRGPEHAAYTTSEVSALAQLDGVALLAKSDEIAHVAEVPGHRSAVVTAAADRRPGAGERTITLRFGLMPESINGTDAVESVTFRRADGTLETIETSLVVRAVGFRGNRVEGLPFDDTTSTLPHTAGSVWEPESGEAVEGVYCAGWIKRGANGVIGTNKSDAAETVDSVLHDLAAGRLHEPPFGVDHLEELVSSRQPDLVDQGGWKQIDRRELGAGKALGRPRKKLVRVDELVAAARSGS
ncbi:4Fe-4S dicluster domain-containing protein [Nocardioides immobilis]|uniref:ferredoxin--NADP(+) reductase n=1 Tax=Nocardioides immobilis TaxID=2049295 RepID=A0A417Y0T5_9ACTN|nr:FAD-dependent oxidoreductase [Nocardioides immobilis]RHW26243.1 4Fe-4S dicluster domain-containing protein [Nocardioides immobilis]